MLLELVCMLIRRNPKGLERRKERGDVDTGKFIVSVVGIVALFMGQLLLGPCCKTLVLVKCKLLVLSLKIQGQNFIGNF